MLLTKMCKFLSKNFNEQKFHRGIKNKIEIIITTNIIHFILYSNTSQLIRIYLDYFY